MNNWRVRTALYVLGGSFICALGLYIYLVMHLPSMRKVTDYRPALSSQVFSSDLERIGEFYKQRRHLTPLDDIPVMVRQAFIAAEDSRFFDHSGIDYLGILRALWKNIVAGGVKQGGSTITQQVAKSLLLTPEKTLIRKMKEAILAYRIESRLSKEEILYLYLNQIYLGHGAYGVGAAARAYFDNNLSELTLAEAALLAGMPTAPSRDNPFANFERAKKRQSYVLRVMREMEFIDEEDELAAREEPLNLNHKPQVNKVVAPHFTEHVRRYLAATYGEEMLYTGGLRVYTSLDIPMQQAALEAVRWNVHEVDKRYGYGGPLRRLNEEEMATYLNEWEQRRSEEPENVALYPPNPIGPHGEQAYQADKVEALVVAVDDKKMKVEVKTAAAHGWIPFHLMRWARTPNEDLPPEHDRIRRPSEALKQGDMILVRRAAVSELPIDARETYAEETLFALEQEPVVEGAVIAMNPKTEFVHAMVGGYDFERSEFNRAIQAKRQPGSAFKPLIYAAALENGYTPASRILDAPVVYDDPTTDKIWRPKNYSGKFYGYIIFRTALVKSHNVATVKIIQNIGLNKAIDYAQKLGIESELTRDNTLALGSSVVTPKEMMQAYATFASGGVKRTPVFIKKVVDRDGNILERRTLNDPTVALATQTRNIREQLGRANIEILGRVDEAEEEEETEAAAATVEKKESPAREVESAEPTEPVEIKPMTQEEMAQLKLRVTRPGQVIKEETAYVMTNLLSSVVRYGTGFRVRALKRTVAGKTGTTNENIDAWFVGYTPDLVTAAWVGFDEKRSMGKLETGSRAASPMWLHFMQKALEGAPQKEFRVPGGVAFVKIDPETGKLADDRTEKGLFMAFVAGTEPSETVDETQGGSTDFFLEE